MVEVKIIKQRENKVTFFEMKNQDLTVRTTNLGCHVLSIFTRDREGKVEDVILGLQDVEDCRRDGSYMGAVVGRVANRIGNARFTLNGKEYQLAANNGPNHLHGGVEGFNQKLFDYKIMEDGIVFTYLSKDMEEGYPGNLLLTVTYRLVGNQFIIRYEAESDQDTLANMTNHMYFNLTGGKEKIYHHKLYMAADQIACVDENCLVDGTFLSVTNTPFDFRTFHEVGERIHDEHEQLKLAGGYDHSFMVNKQSNQAVLYEPKSGRKLTISTTLPAIQVYTANFLEGGMPGKHGKPYENRDGIALETQYLPDSINVEKEPKVILRKGQKYEAVTTYRFEVEGNDGAMFKEIEKLVQYGLDKKLIQPEDKIYMINQYLDLFGLDEYEPQDITGEEICLSDILEHLTDFAYERQLIESNDIVSRDLFDTKLMGVMVERPSRVIDTFQKIYSINPEAATDYFYRFSQDTNYIRRDRIKKDMKWQVSSEYGDIDITINLSKPEKDPKAIAAAKNAKQSAYPKCQLCVENEGYAGRMNHPARENHRIIPMDINGGKWGFQYSPYVYYQEHCIVLNGEHTPMKIERATFEKLFDFVDQFPHYFLGSNADLPIVGGSILSHDHFQGGHYTFAMEKAKVEKTFTIPGYEEVEAGILHWPLSVIRIRCKDRKKLIDLADHILNVWRGYTDEEAYIFAQTDGEPHNTITPIARKKGEYYELDLALRNNITTKECPLGLYHPHKEYHHIKKENIGLIEVMGLAVLPSRLKAEMELLAECLVEKKSLMKYEMIQKHIPWAEQCLQKYDDINETNVMLILKEEIGQVFVKVLEDAGVYKCTKEGREAFDRFLSTL